MAALSFLRGHAPGQVETLLGWWKHLRQERASGSLPRQPGCCPTVTNRKDVEGGATEVRDQPGLNHPPGGDSFLALCERLFALSLEEEALRTRASEARGKGDQEAMDEMAEEIEANTVERRIVLWRLQEMANSARG
jgi:hypothetical protein